MTSEANLQQSMDEESLAATYYRNRAKYSRSQGDEITAKLFEHIAEEEDGHYNEFKDRLNVILSSPRHEYDEYLQREGERAQAFRERTTQRLTPSGAFLETEISGVYVTITEPGNTYWQIGQSVTAEEFDRENKKLESLGKRQAKGEYHY